MRTSLVLASLAAALLDPVAGYTPQQDGILAFPLKASFGAPLVKDITKRQLDAAAESRLTGTLYTIDVTVGTPGQTVSLQVDTGSAETWVNPICSNSYNPQLCVEAGQVTQSTSLTDLYTEGTVQYGNGYVNFRYYYDFFTIAGRESLLIVINLCYCETLD